jgi:hypothetical protein
MAQRGRPTLLTDTVSEAICVNLELAMPLKLAAECEGIGERTVHEWIERGENGEEPFSAFSAAVTRARAMAAKNLTKSALAGGKGSGAASWFLERRFRADYGAHQTIDLNADPRELAKLRDDILSKPVGDDGENPIRVLRGAVLSDSGQDGQGDTATPEQPSAQDQGSEAGGDPQG